MKMKKLERLFSSGRKGRGNGRDQDQDPDQTGKSPFLECAGQSRTEHLLQCGQWSDAHQNAYALQNDELWAEFTIHGPMEESLFVFGLLTEQ